MGKLARQKLLAGNNAKSTTMDTTGSATWGWCGVCIGGWVWGGGAKLATSAKFRQVKNYRLTSRFAKSEMGSRTACSVSCVNGPAPPSRDAPV